jgi:glucarate dehydratase
VKLKGGVLLPEEELRTVRHIFRERFLTVKISFDPNAAWSVETSIKVLSKMMDYGIEYAEDPAWGIEGISLIRRDVPFPLATNMCLISFDQIPVAVRSRCVDIILSDVHY